MGAVYYICFVLFNLIALIYTTQVKSLREISSLQNDRTCIRNRQELLEKLNQLLQGGRDRLQIVTDFDQTLTADPYDSGKKVLNSFEMLRLCPSMPQSYKDADYNLYLKYKHVESDPNLSLKEKSKLMVEWYTASHNLLQGLKYPRDELKNITENVSNSFRDGIQDFIHWSEVNSVPVLVLSSGLGDAVKASLNAANLSTPNVKVISNFLDLNKDDVIIGMKGESIHSFNKNQASLHNTDYYKTLVNRTNVLLLGDSMGDANMADGMDCLDTVIKIGFLSQKKQNELQQYLKHFDIVLLNDQTLSVVNSIVNLLI